MKAKCPIIPVAIIDSYKAFDTGSTENVNVQVHYLEPITYDEYKMLKTTEVAEIVKEKIKNTILNEMKASAYKGVAKKGSLCARWLFNLYDTQYKRSMRL